MTRIPKYRPHSSRRFALVEYQGHRQRLPGKYNSPESKRAYRAFLAQIMAAEESDDEGHAVPSATITVAELVRRYLLFAETYYRGSAEYGCAGDATAPLLARYGRILAEQFGPRRLRRVRRIMVAGEWRLPPSGSGERKLAWKSKRTWSRGYINHQINRIRRMFRWGVSEELVPARVSHALQTLPPLRKGRPDGQAEAHDRSPVSTVPQAHIDAVLPHVAPPVRAMIQLQAITGMRSQTITAMRRADIRKRKRVWEYVPAEHKTAWRGKKLFIALGPRSQAILEPFMDRAPEAYLFSPIEAAAWRSEQRRAARVSPMTPSQAARHAKPLEKRGRPPGDRYTTASYRRAIAYGIKMANRAIDKANEQAKPEDRKPPIPTWHPHQLRHNAGTAVRKKYKAEAARAFLGHGHLRTAEIYAERDRALVRKIAFRMG